MSFHRNIFLSKYRDIVWQNVYCDERLTHKFFLLHCVFHIVVTMSQFHQHFTHAFFVRKWISLVTLGFVIFWRQNFARIKRWWNWRHVTHKRMLQKRNTMQKKRMHKRLFKPACLSMSYYSWLEKLLLKVSLKNVKINLHRILNQE